MNWSKIEHFNRSEFVCQCGCGSENMDEETILRLDAARTIADIPFEVRSGFRCPDHNESLVNDPNYRASKNSSHMKGLAVDIKALSSTQRWIIVRALMDAGFERILIDCKKGFIHVDLDRSKEQKILTCY